MLAYGLPKTPFQPVPLDCGMLVLGDNDPHPRMDRRGSGDPDLKVCGPDSLPLPSNCL